MATVTFLARVDDGKHAGAHGTPGQCSGCRGKVVLTLTDLTADMLSALGAGWTDGVTNPLGGGCTMCGRPFPQVTLNVNGFAFTNEADITAWWLAKA